jgi:hypothetical protein
VLDALGKKSIKADLAMSVPPINKRDSPDTFPLNTLPCGKTYALRNLARPK